MLFLTPAVRLEFKTTGGMGEGRPQHLEEMEKGLWLPLPKSTIRTGYTILSRSEKNLSSITAPFSVDVLDCIHLPRGATQMPSKSRSHNVVLINVLTFQLF